MITKNDNLAIKVGSKHRTMRSQTSLSTALAQHSKGLPIGSASKESLLGFKAI